MMIGNFIFVVSGLIELSIGALVLAVAVMFKGIDVPVNNPLNQERLVLFPYAAVLLLSGLLLLLPGIKPLRCLITLNLLMHALTALFSPCCCGLMARRTPFQSQSRDTKDIHQCFIFKAALLIANTSHFDYVPTPEKTTFCIANYTVNNILGTMIGMSVLAFLLALLIICYGLAILPPRNSEDSPVPKPGSSTTTDPLCPKSTKLDSEPAEG